MKKFGKITKRVLSFTLAVLMTVSCLPAAFVMTKADEEPAPAHSKTIIPNGDGTYTIVLDVTGATSSQTNYSKINVLVLFDTSRSMTSNSVTTYTENNQGSYGYVNGEYVQINNGKFTYTGDRYKKNKGTYSKDNNGTYGLVNGEYVELTVSSSYYSTTYSAPYSGQRYSQTSETRLAVAQKAVKDLAKDLLANNDKDKTTTADDDIVEMGLITFDTKATTKTFGTKKTKKTTSYTDFSAVFNNTTDTGTNWEAALKMAADYDFGDNDPTYVIFVSDGNPSNYLDNSGNKAGTGWDTDEKNVATCYGEAKDPANALVQKGLKFYAIGIFGNVDRMQGLVNYAYTKDDTKKPSGEYYFSASDADALTKALNNIKASMEYSGFGSVEIDDGTTESVKTTSGTVANMLNVDKNSFKYYRSGTKYGSKDYANKNYGTAWSDAPKADYVIDKNNGTSTIEWDLSSINAVEDNDSAKGMLENGVTYTMTAVCAPSQDTYDLIAILKNNKDHSADGITYGELAAGLKGFFKADMASDKIVGYDDLDDEIKKYLDTNYKLKTNTQATMSYSIDGVPVDPVTFDAPSGVDTDATSVSVNKNWINDLDTRTMSQIGISVLCDGEHFTNVVLKSESGWADTINIAPGLLKMNADGSVTVWNAGHDYTVEEYTPGTTISPADYHWEPVVEVYHPMIIGQNLVMLLRTDAPEGAGDNANYFKDASGKEYYKLLNGNWYTEEDTSNFAINITNERRSNLNITKVLNLEEGEIAAEHAKFEFTITIENSNAENDPANDGELWFSVTEEGDTNFTPIKGLTVSTNVTAATGSSEGYYFVKSGEEFTIELEAGWNLRFTNLPTGTYYKIVETEMPTGFEYDGGSVTYGNNKVETAEDENADIVDDSCTVAGKLTESNMLYTVTLANKLSSDNKTKVKLEKVWDDDNDRDRKQPASGEITASLELVYKDGSKQVIDGAVALKKSEDWTKVFDNLPLYDKDGNKIGTSSEDASYYTATEVSDLAPDYTYAVETAYKPTDNGSEYTVTLTNTHEIATTSVTVTKVWNDDNDRDLKRPATIVIKLLADGKETGKTFEIKKDDTGNALTHTWTDLPLNADGQAIVYTVSEDTPRRLLGKD